MKDNVFFSSEANADIDYIFSFHLQRSMTSARRVVTNLLRCIKEERGLPLEGMNMNNKVIPDIEYKVLICDEYLVVYRDDDSNSYIMRVFNLKRDLGNIRYYFTDEREDE